MRDWTCQQLLKKKRHDQANQLQLLFGYEQMHKKDKVAEVIADWMQQLEKERQILSIPLEQTSVTLAYYQKELKLTVDAVSFECMSMKDYCDEALAESLNRTLSYLSSHSVLTKHLHIKLHDVADNHMIIEYKWAFKQEAKDVLNKLTLDDLVIEEILDEIIIMKQIIGRD